MPRASSVVTSADPPAETSGSGTPMTGSSPMTAPMLMIAWTEDPGHDAGRRRCGRRGRAVRLTSR